MAAPQLDSPPFLYIPRVAYFFLHSEGSLLFPPGYHGQSGRPKPYATHQSHGMKPPSYDTSRKGICICLVDLNSHQRPLPILLLSMVLIAFQINLLPQSTIHLSNSLDTQARNYSLRTRSCADFKGKHNVS